MKKTVCELFAGVGGFRLGLERSSKEWTTVWFNQWEPGRKQQYAHDCYVDHFGTINGFNNMNTDISEVIKTDIPEHNLLVGGFPCQDYSVARSLSGGKGINGKKGVLWWDIREILEVKRPAFVLLENVDRLLKSPASQRGKDFGIMLACFNELGYSVEWRVINAAEYGGAQRRRRVFIFAYRTDTNYKQSIDKLSNEEVISTEGFFAKTFPVIINKQGNEIMFQYESIADVSDAFKFQFENSGCMRKGKIYTVGTNPIEEPPIPLKGILETDVDEKYYLGEDVNKWEYLKGAKKINRTSKTGHNYVFSEGPIAFPDDINKPARTMLTSESSLNRSTHVIRDPQTNRLRLLTPLGAERIQGFEDNWTNTGMTEKFRYFCMGNALVVSLVERMGFTLNEIFEAED